MTYENGKETLKVKGLTVTVYAFLCHNCNSSYVVKTTQLFTTHVMVVRAARIYSAPPFLDTHNYCARYNCAGEEKAWDETSCEGRPARPVYLDLTFARAATYVTCEYVYILTLA